MLKHTSSIEEIYAKQNQMMDDGPPYPRYYRIHKVDDPPDQATWVKSHHPLEELLKRFEPLTVDGPYIGVYIKEYIPSSKIGDP